MAKDIYDVTLGNPVAWKLDGLLINFGDKNKDLLATSCNLSYQRSLSNHFPINTDQRIIVSGTPQGTLQIGSIVGPVGDLKAFLDRFGDVCQVNTNTMSIRPGGIKPCKGEGRGKLLKFTLSGCLINSFGLTVENSNGMGIVNSSISMQFTGLQAENTN